MTDEPEHAEGIRIARLEGRMDRIEDKLDWLHDCLHDFLNRWVPIAVAFVVGAVWVQQRTAPAVTYAPPHGRRGTQVRGRGQPGRRAPLARVRSHWHPYRR
jgi:hypothetical protein